MEHMTHSPIQRRLERLARDRWARRSMRVLLRSAWIGLSLLCVGLGLQMLNDLEADTAPSGLPWLDSVVALLARLPTIDIALSIWLALALGCVGVGATLLLRRRMRMHEVAQRLDRRFDLNQQLSTALEVSASGNAEGVAQRLVEQATATTGKVQRYIKQRQHPPWVEMLTLLAMVLLSLGLLLFHGLGAMGDPPTAEALPPLVQQPPLPDEPVPPDQQPPPEQGIPGPGDNASQQSGTVSGANQRSAEVLADAMRDQSVTRSAAEQLDEGDAAGAAQSLRELADQASGLSDEARRDLADRLRQAASELEASDTDLADQVRQSAYGLQQEGESSADALENLADAVEQLSQNPGDQQAQNAPQSESNQQSPQSQQGEAGQQGQAGASGAGAGNVSASEQREREQSMERLDVEGVPLELESQGTGTPGEEETPDQTVSGGGTFTRGDQQNEPDGTSIQLEEDPLTIPPELRDVVQEYFTPVR